MEDDKIFEQILEEALDIYLKNENIEINNDVIEISDERNENIKSLFEEV